MKKVLIIEDEELMYSLLEKRLSREGYDVVVAHDGEEGLEMAQQEKPDLVLLDIVMPKKNGFEVSKELKNDPKYYFFSKIPVMMLTVYPDERDSAHLSILDGMEMDAEDYLHKPFEIAELLSRTESLLRKKPRGQVS